MQDIVIDARNLNIYIYVYKLSYDEYNKDYHLQLRHVTRAFIITPFYAE